jgi:hypothetical protein
VLVLKLIKRRCIVERVYENIEEVKANLKVVPTVKGRGRVSLDLYLDGKKVGYIDRRNNEVRVKVRMAGGKAALKTKSQSKNLNNYIEKSKFEIKLASAVPTGLPLEQLKMLSELAELAPKILKTTFAVGERDYNYWKEIGMHVPHPQGSAVDWRKFDWSKYDQGSYKSTIKYMLELYNQRIN